MLGAGFGPQPGQGGLEEGAVVGGEAAALGPGFIGRGAVRAAGAGGGVGFGAGGDQVVASPMDAAVAGGMRLRSRFQRADAGLDGAIVPRHRGR